MGRPAHGARLAGRRRDRRPARRATVGGADQRQRQLPSRSRPSRRRSTSSSLKATDTQSLPYLLVVEKTSGLTDRRPARPSRPTSPAIPGLSLRRGPVTDRRRVPARSAADRGPQPGQPGRPHPGRVHRGQGRGHHRRELRPVCRRRGPARGRYLGAGPVRHGLPRHRTRRVLRGLHHRLRRDRRDPALRRPRRRLPHPAHRLPQPDPAHRGAGHRPVRPVRRGAGDLPAGQERVDQPERAEPGHPLDPRRRRRDRLRPPPRREVQGGAARQRVDVGGDEGRLARGRRADRGQCGDGDPRAALPAACRSSATRRGSDRWARSASRARSSPR